MIYILISIFCSVTVGIIFKSAKRYQINIPQIICWNYLVAMVCCMVFFDIPLKSLQLPSSPVYIYLGILLPAIFAILARSISQIGIAKTDIAQRLSLFIPLLASYFLFGEQFTLIKLFALALGLAAIVFILSKKGSKSGKGNIVYPLLVFVGYGIVDVLFKQVALLPAISYPASLLIVFVLAFLISLVAVLYFVLREKQQLKLINLACGISLGLFNFANIFFYLKAHHSLAKTPSVVFAAMNLGVIVLGTLVGVYLFKEKLSRLNKIGIFLALLSIVILTASQLYGGR
jgi:drug/metabolite transporter (DMT)-like permease